MKRLGIVTAFFCLCYLATASDMQTGYAFSSGEKNVTHTKLNNAVNQATILPGFFTDKPATTTPSATDLALIYSFGAGGLRKVTLGTLFYGNPFIITNLTADVSPAADDLLMTYDVSDLSLKKATLRDAVFESAQLINARTNWPNPNADTTYVLAYDTGAWSKLSRIDLFYHFANFATFTNLDSGLSVTNDDTLLVWDSVTGTNRTLTLSNLFTKPVTATGLTNTDTFLIWSTATNSGTSGTNLIAKTTLQTLQNYLSNNVVQPAVSVSVSNATLRFASWDYPITSTGIIAATNHGLGSIPIVYRWVLSNQVAELGFSVGEEVDVTCFTDSGERPGFTFSASATQIFLTRSDETPLRVRNRSGVNAGQINDVTPARWRAKGYAIK